MNDGISTQFKTEGAPAFPVETPGEGSPTESSPETKPDATDPSSGGKPTDEAGGDKGLADHPRWKEREEDWKARYNEQERRHTEALDAIRKEMEGLRGNANAKPPEANTEVPEWWGGTEEHWLKFQSWQQEQLSKAEQAVRAKLESGEKEQQQRIDAATKYFEDQVVAIENDKTLNPNAEKIDRNKLLKFVMDNDLVDSKGQWNYRAAYQLLKAQSGQQPKPDATKERKDLAAASTSDGRGETKKSDVMTSEDFRKPGARPW